MKITYTQVGDYFIPDIFLQEIPLTDEFDEPLGRYARMRRAFLKEHRTIFYNTLLLSEQLYSHLREIDITANERRTFGVSEEVIFAELIYD